MRDGDGPGRPEVWAGVECTLNRVGDRYFDQLRWSGHDRRADDLDRLAALGVVAVRYPVLWEKVAPDPAGPADWSWPDARLGRLRALGVRPIVGLVHHGSGPPHTSLTDPGFADGLAAFAGRVAERYPWVDAYTPVNEPLTTARFSGLYGHWYPHGTDDRTFAAALVTQCRAVALAMAAVRRVRPGARLIQTDDLGRTHAPPALGYQAEFENERRWATWDLLSGRVVRGHPMWDYLRWAGVGDAALGWFADHPCPPDVVGVNYYLTSERYLDDDLGRYPAGAHGGNGRHRYVDTEAVRARQGGAAGPDELLTEAWDRYRRPVAVTEAHLGCTREDQVRWLAEVWHAACRCRAAGADVVAVTAWSAFGAFDWDSLVTRPAGRYEPGAFDVRSDPPRPTAVAGVVREMAAGRDPSHPVLDAPGWWRRPERFLFPGPPPAPSGPPPPARRLLLTGATGGLGRALARACQLRGLPFAAPSRQDLDITDPAAVAAALDAYRPWAVVNAAGFARVGAAEADPDRCRRANVVGPAVLAAACRRRGVPLATFSSDLVFDGRSGRPYREADPVAPVNVYGASKAEAERRVLAVHPAALVVRAGAVFGQGGGADFVARALRSLRGGGLFAAADDLTVSPSYAPDVADAALDLVIDGASGVWHVAGPDPATWADLARAAARAAGLDPGAVVPRPSAALGRAARLPTYTPLATARGFHLPPLAEGLVRFLQRPDLLPAA